REGLGGAHKIAGEEQAAFSLRSHQRVTMARAKLAEEIVPVPIPPRFEAVATKDNGVRENQSLEALAKLKPYFDRRYGTVTAGNSPPVTHRGAGPPLVSARAAQGPGFPPPRRHPRPSLFAPPPRTPGPPPPPPPPR